MPVRATRRPGEVTIGIVDGKQHGIVPAFRKRFGERAGVHDAAARLRRIR
jgi:hypothetical protein